MIRTYSQIRRTDKYSQHSSIIWPPWLTKWLSVRLRTKWLWVRVLFLNTSLGFCAENIHLHVTKSSTYKVVLTQSVIGNNEYKILWHFPIQANKVGNIDVLILWCLTKRTRSAKLSILQFPVIKILKVNRRKFGNTRI